MRNSSRSVRIAAGAALAAMMLAGAACSSPEAKVAKYNKSGEEYLEAGRLGAANVQFRNALKIDENNIAAMRGLIKIAEKKSDFNQMYGQLQALLRVAPKDIEGRLQLSKLFLLGNDATKSLETVASILADEPQNADAIAVKSAVMFRLQNNAEAVALAKQALAIKPTSEEAIAVLASERVANKDNDGALKILDDAIARDSKSAVLQLLRLQILDAAGRKEEMNGTFDKLIATYPDEASYRRLYVTKLLDQKKFDDARVQLVEVVRIHPKEVAAKLDVVRIDYRLGGREKAEATLRKYIAENKEEIELELALGAFLREQKDFVKAEEIYKSIAERKGVDLDDALKAKNEIAAIRMLERKRPEAEALINEILTADPRNPDALVKRAGLRIDDGKIDDAIGDLRVVVDEHPDTVPARLLLAAAYESKGDLNLAESEMATAVEKSNRAVQPSNLFARYLLRHDKTDRAETVLAESISLDPSSEENLKLLAAIRLGRQDWRGAEEAAKALQAITKNDEAASGILGAAYSGLKDYAGAIDVLTQQNNRSPLAGQPLVNLVQAYIDAGQTKEAEDFLTTMVEKNPALYEPRVLLAQVQRRNGRAAVAIESLRAAIDRDPVRSEAYESLYGVYVMEGRRQDAGVLINEATSALPDNDGLQILKADHLIAINQPEGAIPIYETILTRRPKDLIVSNNLASLLLDRVDAESHQRALAVADVLRESDNPFFQDTYGWALFLNGKQAEGAAILQKAAQGAPRTPVIRYHLGVALFETGQTVRGREELAAIIGKPGLSDAQIADAKRRLGQ